MTKHNQAILPKDVKASNVLIATLDWGMGHTTRTVGIVRQLLDQENNVVFAGNERQCQFIKQDFPEIETTALKGYNIFLDSRKNTYWQLVKQLSKFQRTIQYENDWLKAYMAKNKVDLIISDNRYGFYHEEITSVLLTHQLNLQVPYFKNIANRIIKKKVERFNTCWIPDTENRLLTGELSSVELNLPVCFIGPLNRFEPIETTIIYDYLVILSGPEPERTNFLSATVTAMKKKNAKVAFVGADVPGFDSFKKLSTKELQKLIAQSDCIYSRAGYTTIMEMAGLNKKALLIPTAGQYEQEYLASYVKHDKIKFIDLFK